MGLSFRDYARCDAVELARLVKGGEIAPDEPANAARSAIEALNPALNAFVSMTPDRPPPRGAEE